MPDEAGAIDLATLREVAKGAAENAVRLAPRPRMTPATIIEYDPTTDQCAVLVDGDDDESTGVPNLTGAPLYNSERVMVQFWPPHGIYVAHALHLQSGFVIRYSSADQTLSTGVTTALNLDTLDSASNPEFFDLTTVNSVGVIVPGWYRMAGRTVYRSAAAGQRSTNVVIDGTAINVHGEVTAATGQLVVTWALERPLLPADVVSLTGLISGAATIAVGVLDFTMRWMSRVSQ